MLLSFFLFWFWLRLVVLLLRGREAVAAFFFLLIKTHPHQGKKILVGKWNEWRRNNVITSHPVVTEKGGKERNLLGIGWRKGKRLVKSFRHRMEQHVPWRGWEKWRERGKRKAHHHHHHPEKRRSRKRQQLFWSLFLPLLLLSPVVVVSSGSIWRRLFLLLMLPERERRKHHPSIHRPSTNAKRGFGRYRKSMGNFTRGKDRTMIGSFSYICQQQQCSFFYK